MSRFWREGHSFTSRLGNDYWVEGHWVERDDWDRFSYQAPPAPEPSPAVTRNLASGRQANFSDANASCPVCGKPVFYYQNEHGSRVFFNHPGPPWEKHGCTDNPALKSLRPLMDLLPVYAHTASVNREPVNLNLPNYILPTAPVEPSTGKWICMVVLRRIERENVLWIRYRPFHEAPGKSFRFSVAANIDCPKTGDTFYMHENVVSFFSFKEFRPIDLVVDLCLPRAKVSKKRRKADQRKRNKMLKS